MRSIVTLSMLMVAVIVGPAVGAEPEGKAKVVMTALVWDGAKHVTSPDLIRVDKRWLLVCQESETTGWQGGTVRVLTSKDGSKWKSTAVIESPTPKRGLYAPSITPTPDGRLTVSALGVVGYANSTAPLPENGGLLKTMIWSSKEGRTWSASVPISPDDYPFDRITWHDGIAFGCAQGRSCGSAQTILIMAGKDVKDFETQYEKTFSKFMPHEGDLLFEEGTAHCLVTGQNGFIQTGWLGSAKAPYRRWEWKELTQKIRHPKFLRLPDKRVIATVGLFDGKPRTALCEFDPSTGMFTELLELTAGNQSAAGLAWHDGHVWVSHSVARGEKSSVHLAKIQLK